MILGIGIDSVEIARFNEWVTFSKERMLRIFSAYELDYCLALPAKSAERLAVRFAAREACFKALSPLYPTAPFLTLCKAITILHNPSGSPVLSIDWEYLAQKGHPKNIQKLAIHLSLTHTRTLATAIVILEKHA